MKKAVIFFLMFFSILACEKKQENIITEHIAKIAGFDLNCSTCIVEFPDDSLQVKKEIGKGGANFYHAINLNKGDYELGQRLRVKFRIAEPGELNACITMYPSYSYENIFLTEIENFDPLILNDTIELPYRDCFYDPVDKFYLCLDTVAGDSRCPDGAVCVWEGNAEVRLKFEKLNEDPVYFNLNTHLNYTTEAVVGGYKFRLVGVSPAPSLKHPSIPPKDYIAKILVEKID